MAEDLKLDFRDKSKMRQQLRALLKEVRKNSFWEYWIQRELVPSDTMMQTSEASRRLAFAVTHITNLRVLETLRDILGEAIEEGRSIDEVKENIGEAFKQKGWDTGGFQWNTIIRTNFANHFNRVHNEMMELTSKEMFPYREFVAVDDDRTTELCRELNGLVVPADSIEYQTLQPPLHFNCRSQWVVAPQDAYNPKTSTEKLRNIEQQGLQPQEGFGSWDGAYQTYAERLDDWQREFGISKEQAMAQLTNYVAEGLSKLAEWLNE
jgi:SPP1 gp7 family putative phage head morphogenesis protein